MPLEIVIQELVPTQAGLLISLSPLKCAGAFRLCFSIVPGARASACWVPFRIRGAHCAAGPGKCVSGEKNVGREYRHLRKPFRRLNSRGALQNSAGR